MLRHPWIASAPSPHYQSHKSRAEKTCFASWQFEDWIFQPPLNLLMFKFLTGKHSKALQASWNLRSLLTRDIELSWRFTDVVGAWLPEGKGEDHSKLFRWCSLSALPIPRPPSIPGPLLFLSGEKVWQPRWFSHLQLFPMKVTLGWHIDSLS